MRAVNLIPAEQRGGSSRGAGRSAGGAYAVLGLLAGFVVLALMYGMAHHKLSSGQAQVKELEGRVSQVQSSASRLAPYTSFAAMREQRTHAVSGLVSSRFDWAHAFHELGRVLPFTVSLTSLSGTVGSAAGSSGSGSGSGSTGGQVASATPAGSVPSFTLSGCALTQTAVADTLARLRLIDGVTSVTLQSSVKTTSGGSGGSSSGGSSGGCPVNDPAFTVQVSFNALPAASALAHPAGASPRTPASTRTVSSTGSAR